MGRLDETDGFEEEPSRIDQVRELIPWYWVRAAEDTADPSAPPSGNSP